MKKILSFLVISAFLCSACFAGDRIEIKKFGGLNTRTNPYEISESESTDCSNFVLDEAGTLTERSLFSRYNSASIGSYSTDYIYKFYLSSDVGYMLLSSYNKLYKATSGALTDISNSSITVIPNSQWSFETFTDGTNEVVFGANNDCDLQYWTGSSTFASVASKFPATKCNVLKKHKARLFATGSRAYPYRVYYSVLNDGDNFNDAGSGSIDLPSYEKIMAMEELGDILCIFTRTGIYALVGDTPAEFYLQKTASKVGTHSYKSVVLGGNLIYFLNKSGIFVFDGNEATNIAEGIQPTVDSISNSYIGSSAGLFDKRGRYWLSYTSANGSFNDTILIYDTVVKQWYKIDGVNFSSFFRADGGMDKGEIFAGASDLVGYIWKLQSSNSLESISHNSSTQLSTGVTSNTVVMSTPVVALWDYGYSLDTATSLLLHFDGNFTDEAGNTATLINAPSIDTSTVKIGTGSVKFNGVNQSISFPDSTSWIFGTSDFTIDIDVNFSDVSGTQGLIGQFNSSSIEWALRKDSDNKLRFYYYSGGVDRGQYVTTSAPTLTTNTWYTIRFVRNGSTAFLFLDGISLPLSEVTAFGDLGDIGSLLYIGNNGAGQYVNGYIDEVRISTISRSVNKIDSVSNGTLTSAPLQINASGQASLGTITWNEELPSNTDIQFTTRTGITGDTVYFNGWQSWVSNSTVVVTGTNANWSTNGNITSASATGQDRNVLFYETDDNLNPGCRKFTVSGAISTNAYVEADIGPRDLSTYKWVGAWIKSPVTGNSVRFSLGESASTEKYITFNTVNVNTWEYHYWPIGNYTGTEVDNVAWVRLTYLGDGAGDIYLGDVYAYDFLDSGDTITSTPNDFIQYRAILGTTDRFSTPELLSSNGYVVSLSYSSSGGTSESSLTSYWESKKFDFGQPNYNKRINWFEITARSNNDVTGNTVYLDYNVDDGLRSGTLSKTFLVTGTNTKVRWYFPTGTYGKDFQFKIRNTDVDDNITINNGVVDYTMEANG